MRTVLIDSLAKLRVAVALLGEHNNWWPTNFFSEESADILNYAFPRSKYVSQAAACDAVKSIMDQKVGANYFHLFRLSINYEELISKHLNEGVAIIKNEDDAKSVLKSMADNLSVNSQAGPKNIGNIDQLDESLIQTFAAEYLKAIESNYQVFPYLN